MSKILINVPYLEGQDINADGSLKAYVGKGKPVVLMVYGSFCPHCRNAMPAYQDLAKAAKNVTVVTVQSDGGESDKAASRALSKVNTSPGVPAFLGFGKDGKFKGMHNGGRDMQALMAFAQGL